MNVGQRIKECRIKMGLTVDELAVKLQKNRATVYRYEKGDIENLPITILEPIANALDTSPAFLMGWTEDSSPFATDNTEKIVLNNREVFTPTTHELALLKAYREQPNMQDAVDRLLGITRNYAFRVKRKSTPSDLQNKNINETSGHSLAKNKKNSEHSSEKSDF